MLTFLRHGQTVWNREGRIQGTLDIPLSETGRRYVEQFVAQHPCPAAQLIWTSPLARARATAAIIARGWAKGHAKLPIRELDLLTERHYGNYQGQRLTDLPKKVLVEREELLQGDGVEPWHRVKSRVMEALRMIAAETDEAIVVVHGGWLKAMHALLQTGLEHENADNLSCFSLARSTLVLALQEVHLREASS
jgi:broad specificity phosphatase PhoE